MVKKSSLLFNLCSLCKIFNFLLKTDDESFLIYKIFFKKKQPVEFCPLANLGIVPPLETAIINSSKRGISYGPSRDSQIEKIANIGTNRIGKD